MKKQLFAGLLALSSLLGAEETVNLDSLDQRLKIAERKLELAAENLDAASKANATVSAGSGGFSIISADKKYSLKIGALLQADSRNYIDDIQVPLTNTIIIRRARIITQATLDKVRLNTAVEFGGAGTAPGTQAAASLVDLFAEIKLGAGLTARIGQFKTPISLEIWRSDPARDFIETGFTTGLVTTRDRGAWLEWADEDQAFSLGGGIFNGGPDGTGVVVGEADSDSKEAVGKLFIHPFRFFDTVTLRDLGLGVAGSIGQRTTGSLGSPVTPGQQAVTALPANANGEQYRIAPQAYLYAGPWSLLSEYVRSSNFTNPSNIIAREAWQAQAGWVISGEDAAFSGLKWNKETTSADWGVWQLVSRYQEFQIDSSDWNNTGAGGFINARSNAYRAEGWGVGLNWLPNPVAKIYLDYDRTSFLGGRAGTSSATAVDNRETEHAIFGRAQFTF